MECIFAESLEREKLYVHPKSITNAKLNITAGRIAEGKASFNSDFRGLAVIDALEAGEVERMKI